MHIRTFQARSIHEALDQVRVQMGDDATILHTRELRSGWMGMLGSRIEVTAGLKGLGPSETNRRAASGDASVLAAGAERQSSVSEFRLSSAKNATSACKSQAAQGNGCNQELAELKAQVIGALSKNEADRPAKSSVQRPAGESVKPTIRIVNEKLEASLLEAGFSKKLADWVASHDSLRSLNLGSDAEAKHHAMQQLIKVIAPKLRIGRAIEVPANSQRLVAVVGPAGVGKTTSIAKLAAGFKLQERRSVGLITIDTFRLAGVDQLTKYADILKAPLRVVTSPAEMTEALRALKDCDLVLIDTIGQSLHDEERFAATKAILQAAPLDETHLAISASASEHAIDATVACFAGLNPSALILTKLDEVVAQPAILKFAGDAAPLLSYVTTGQRVPGDIDLPNADRLARLALADWNGSQQQALDTIKNHDERTVTQNVASRPIKPKNLLAPRE